jgi:hypothetical protein
MGILSTLTRRPIATPLRTQRVTTQLQYESHGMAAQQHENSTRAMEHALTIAKSLTPGHFAKLQKFPDIDVIMQSLMGQHAMLLIRRILQFDVEFGDSAATHVWPQLLIKAYPCMSDFPLDQMLLRFVGRVWRVRSTLQSHMLFDSIEFWGGCAELTYQHLLRDLICAAFDINYHEDHDCLSQCGLKLWLDCLTSTKRGCLNWFGTQCSSFLVCCMSQSNRNSLDGYLGDEAWVQCSVLYVNMLVVT